MEDRPMYEEVTLEDIEEYRRTGKFSKNVDKGDEFLIKAWIMDGYSNKEILEGLWEISNFY